MTHPVPVSRRDTQIYSIDKCNQETDEAGLWVNRFFETWSKIVAAAHSRVSRMTVGSGSSEEANFAFSPVTPEAQKESMIRDVQSCMTQILGKTPSEGGYNYANPPECYKLLQKTVVLWVHEKKEPQEILQRCPGVMTLLQPIIEEQKNSPEFWDKFGAVVVAAVARDPTQFFSIPIPPLLQSVDDQLKKKEQHTFWKRIFAPVIASIVENDIGAFFEQLGFGFSFFIENRPFLDRLQPVIDSILMNDQKRFFGLLSPIAKDLLQEEIERINLEQKEGVSYAPSKRERLALCSTDSGNDVFFEILSPGVLLLADLLSQPNGRVLTRQIQETYSLNDKDAFFNLLNPQVYRVIESRLLTKEGAQSKGKGVSSEDWKASQWYIRIAFAASSITMMWRLKEGMVKNIVKKQFARYRPISPCFDQSSPLTLSEGGDPDTVPNPPLERTVEYEHSSSSEIVIQRPGSMN